MKLFSRNDGGEDFKLGERNLKYSLFSFKILIENEVSYLKVLGRSKDLSRYQSILDYLKRNFMIVGEIDCRDDIGITFKNPDMSVMMAIAMIKNNWAISQKEYDFLDLAKLLKKLYQSITKGGYKNLQDDIMLTLISKYDEVEKKHRKLNKISSSLALHTPTLMLSIVNRGKMCFEQIDLMLKDITEMLCYSTKLIRSVIREMMLLKDKCNEVAYLAALSVETLKNIYIMHPLEFQSLARECFKGCDSFLEDVQLDIDNIISVYLRKFKLSHGLLDLIDDRKSNKNNVMYYTGERLNIGKDKNKNDIRSEYIISIDIVYIKELQECAYQLNKVREISITMLTKYDRIKSGAERDFSALSILFPDRDMLISPLFHKYNSLVSPLISAICDKKLIDVTNLYLFRDLSRARAYQQSKMNVSIYGESPDYSSEFMSPLCYAVEYRTAAVVRILLENGASVNPVDNRKTPLHRAMIRGVLEIVKLLLEYGARPDMVTDDQGLTPLHHASNAECASYLINWAVSNNGQYPQINLQKFVNARDRSGNTPLLSYVQREIHFKDACLDPKILNKAELQSYEHLRLVEHLIDRNAELDVVNIYGHTALHYALILKTGRNNGTVQLSMAMTLVRLLVDGGADVNIMSNRATECFGALKIHQPFPMMTPLLALYDFSYLKTIRSCPKREDQIFLRQIAEMLINHGAVIDIFDGSNNSTLSKAIVFGDHDAVSLLLESGANPNFRHNKKEPTPLHYCMNATNRKKCVDSDLETLKHLLYSGASPQLQMHQIIDVSQSCKEGQFSLSINTETMQLIMSQDNEISRKDKILEGNDRNSNLEIRYRNVFSSLKLDLIRVTVKMNPIEYARYKNNGKRAMDSRMEALFIQWLDFYQSADVKNLLNLLCLSPLWTQLPKDLIYLIAQFVTVNSVHSNYLRQWIIAGRDLPKSKTVYQESRSGVIGSCSTFFYRNAVCHEDSEGSELGSALIK